MRQKVEHQWNVSMNKYRSIFVIVSGLIFVGVVTQSIASNPMPDETVDNRLLYVGPHIEAFKTSSGDECPYFLLTTGGTGYLKSRKLSLVKEERPHSAPPAVVEGNFPDDWFLRKSFLKADDGWEKLTKAEADRMWQERSEHTAHRRFISYDISSEFNGESNIYHLDLQFGTQVPVAYRLRGIGITNPKWISKGDLTDKP